jgi:hypothetical protein
MTTCLLIRQAIAGDWQGITATLVRQPNCGYERLHPPQWMDFMGLYFVDRDNRNVEGGFGAGPFLCNDVALQPYSGQSS